LRVVDGGGCHVTSGERDKRKKRGRTLRPPLLAAIVVVVGGERRWWWHLQLQVVSPPSLLAPAATAIVVVIGGERQWWWHLQLQVLSSLPSSFVDACSCRWCRRRRCRPFTCSCRCCRRHRRRLCTPAAAGGVAVVVRSHLQPQVWSPLSSVGTDMVVGGERRWWWW